MVPDGFVRAATRLLLVAALAAGGSATAHAQRLDNVNAVLEVYGHKLTMTSREMKALSDLQASIAGRRIPIQDAALAAARGAAQSPDARFALALYELEIGRQRSDDALRGEALDVLIASGLTPRENLPGYLSVRGGIAYQRGDLETARTLWTRLLALKPNDASVLANLAQVSQAGNDPNGAADLLGRAIAEQTVAGKPVSETLYRQWMSVAHQGHQVQPGIAAAHALVRAYPSPANWRDALVVYRQLAQPAGALEIDLMRLMRATGTLSKASEYQRMAQLLEHGGLAAEARTVLDEGLSRDLLDPLDPLTRQIIAEVERARTRPGSAAPGSGRYAEAVALALAGRRAEAEPLFRSVAAQPGDHRDLAIFWLDWLAR